ncbi:MAG: mannosyl-3-phosphoglycerate synthase [Calditrichaeota bacterium]|nr:MAG: mannosyl-3-phosphoglycerate synthase [Calditrichota bacterium]
MRIELPREAERFGANLFHGVQKVYELDSGLSTDIAKSEESVIQRIPYEQLYEIEKQMVIVVPVCGERIKLIEGVLFAIPHQCLVIIVSNSPREHVDRFLMEKNAIENFCKFSKKNVIVVHQKDPVFARAFAEAGYLHILNKKDKIRSGKAEGMMLATMLARLTGRKYIGFIDADNYFPGAAHEYILEYAAGFATSFSNYIMVRIVWQSKPKVMHSNLYFAKWGRTSVVTNHFLNLLISHYTGFETEVIKTGNAGEHALTMDLAMLLDYSSGYSIETRHFTSLMEKFGGIVKGPHPELMKQHIDVFQIESRNPHLHESKGKEHVEDMIYASLQVIYHSPLCPESIRHEIVKELQQKNILKEDQLPAKPTYYPALEKINLKSFLAEIQDHPFSNLLSID